MDLIEWTDDGAMRVNFHPGQIRAWDSLKRFVCVFSGTQGGKTEMGPPWLLREIQLRGPGDHMIVTPTFPLLELKALPAFKHLFETKEYRDLTGQWRTIHRAASFSLSPVAFPLNCKRSSHESATRGVSGLPYRAEGEGVDV
jgi:hypothetical protein